MNLAAKEIHLVVVKFWLYSYKLPGNIHALHCICLPLAVFMYRYTSIHALLELWVQVGGGMGQGPVYVTHLGFQFFQ